MAKWVELNTDNFKRDSKGKVMINTEHVEYFYEKPMISFGMRRTGICFVDGAKLEVEYDYEALRKLFVGDDNG